MIKRKTWNKTRIHTRDLIIPECEEFLEFYIILTLIHSMEK